MDGVFELEWELAHNCFRKRRANGGRDGRFSPVKL